MAITHGMKFCGLGVLSLVVIASAACGGSKGGNNGGAGGGTTTAHTTGSNTTATTGSNTTATTGSNTTATTGSNTTASTTGSTTSSSGGGVGCAMSVAPAGMSIATFDGDGGFAVSGGIATYGGTAAPTTSTATGALVVTENAPAATAAQYVGVVAYVSGDTMGKECLDAHSFTGVKFDISGTLSGCTVQFSINDSEHADSTGTDPKASGPAGSYSPQLSVTVPAAKTTMMVPFTGAGAPTGGSPATAIDPAKLTGVQWQFTIPAAGTAACMSSLTIDNLSFY